MDEQKLRMSQHWGLQGLEVVSWVTCPTHDPSGLWAICLERIDSKTVLYSIVDMDEKLGEMGFIGDPNFERLDSYVRDAIAAKDVVYYDEIYNGLVFEKA